MPEDGGAFSIESPGSFLYSAGMKSRILEDSLFTFVGPGMLLASALMFAVMDGTVKLVDPTLRVWDIGFYRFFSNMIFLILISGRRSNPFLGKNVPLLIIRGVVGSIAFLSVIAAIRLIPISTAMVLFFSFPAFTAVFSPLIFGERISIIELIWVFIAILGVVVLFEFRWEINMPGQILGQTMALTGAVFAGLTVTVIKKLRDDHGTIPIYLYFCLLGTIITFPMFISQPGIPETALDWILILVIVTSSLLGQLLMTNGIRYCKSWESGILMMTELIFTSILGIVFLSETVGWRFWAGGSMILLSVVMLQFHHFSKIR
jgi:drug/metabolite transporter (DMT)-like permease